MVNEVGLASAITMLHALEKGVHDSGPWTMDLDGVRLPAMRVVTEYGVSFVTEFPEMNFSGETSLLTLFCGQDMVLVKNFTAPDHGSFVVDWSLSLPAQVAA